MSTTQKIFIGILVLVVIAIIIIVVNYYSKKAPDVSTTTSLSQTSGLSAVGGIGGIGALFAQLSDERFKTNISKTGWGSAYNQIQKITPMEYMYRDADGTAPCDKGCKISGVKKIGFIAQDVERVNPNLIITDKNGIKYVDLGQMIGLQFAAMKKMQQDLEYQRQLLNSNPQYGGRATN